MADARSLITVRSRDLSKNLLIAGKSGPLARRAIAEHLALRQMRLGGGCLYLDTRGDASVVYTMRRAMQKMERPQDLQWLDMTQDDNFQRVHVELPAIMVANQNCYLWMPIERIRGRVGETLARVAMGLRSGFLARRDLAFNNASFTLAPTYLVADGSDDSSSYFWDLCGRTRAPREGNCGLAMVLPTMAPERCRRPDLAIEVIDSAYTRVEVLSGDKDEATQWRVRIAHGDRLQEAWYPGFHLELSALRSTYRATGLNWLKMLIGG